MGVQRRKSESEALLRSEGGCSFDSQKQRLFRDFHHLGICEVVNFPERLSWPRRYEDASKRTGQPLLEQEQNELGCSVFRRIDLFDEIGL